MSLKENKDLIIHVYDLCSRKKTDELFELYEPGYIEHTRSGNAPFQQLRQTTLMFFKAFQDSTFTAQNLVAENDKVAYQVIVTGTHKDTYMGLPPTGKRIEMHDTSIKRIANGKLAESWGTIDMISLMRQLGMLPEKK